jgi:GntR family transcriptional regulator
MNAAWLTGYLAEALAKESRTPLYERLIQALRDAIERGLLSVDQPLPPEPDLAAHLGLSRKTVNQALTALARQGLLVRRRGIGTFVAAPAIEQPLEGLYSFIRSLTAQGRTPSSRVLGTRLTVNDAASTFLTNDDAGLVFELTRIRLVDGDPLVFEETYLPADAGERIPRELFATDVLYDLLRDHAGLAITHADETMRPVLLDRAEAALLGAVPGDPAFLVERRGFAGDSPIELRRSVIRGDRYRFTVHLPADSLAPGESERSC